MKRLFLKSVLLLALLALSSCAAVGVSLLGAGASLIADQGVGHIMSSRVERTFPMPLEGVRVATIQSASQMNLTIDSVDRTEAGYVITGRATNRRVEIELEWVSDQATRMQVDVKLSFFKRDRATATAIVEHTESALSQLKVVQNGNWRGLSTRVPTAEVLRAYYSHSPSRPSTSPSRNDWSRQERWLSMP
jgi:hypothetical protein